MALIIFAEHRVSLNETELTEQALTDALTGLPNRYAFDMALAREAARALRNKSSLVLAVIDVDHFKSINDRYGHHIGDQVLREVAKILGGQLRTADIVSRWGGEEFAILLPDLDLVSAKVIVERLRELIAQHSFNYGKARELSLTVSIGLAAVPNDGEPSKAFARADRALYAAKDSGRNRTVALTQSDDPHDATN
jgi:diguanylate cyclase (GGDEF)-like protein